MNDNENFEQVNSPELTYDQLKSTVVPQTAATGDDDFDASEYVRKLIARMGSGDSPSSIPVPRVEPTSDGTSPTAPTAAEPSIGAPVLFESHAALPLSEAPDSLSELQATQPNDDDSRRRSRDANARPVDLAKLREAANLSTSTVLHVFECKSLIRRAYSELTIAGVSMVTSLVLITMSERVKSFAFLASVAMLGIASFATMRYAITTRTLSDKQHLR